MKLTHSSFRHISIQGLRNLLAAAPRTYSERERRVISEFQMRGAVPRRLPIQDTDGKLLDECNIEVVLPGDSKLAPIYLTAHHDHEPVGHGVVDNWSGVVALFELFDRFSRVPPERPIVLVSFALEECNHGQSLAGSRHYVLNLDGQPIHANVNLECLGPGPLHYWSYSDDAITKPEGIPRAKYGDLVSDGQSFHEIAGCPTIVFDGIAAVNEPIIHTIRDTIDAIDIKHYVHSVEQIETYVRVLSSLQFQGLVRTNPQTPTVSRSPSVQPQIEHYVFERNRDGLRGKISRSEHDCDDSPGVTV